MMKYRQTRVTTGRFPLPDLLIIDLKIDMHMELALGSVRLACIHFFKEEDEVSAVCTACAARCNTTTVHAIRSSSTFETARWSRATLERYPADCAASVPTNRNHWYFLSMRLKFGVLVAAVIP